MIKPLRYLWVVTALLGLSFVSGVYADDWYLALNKESIQVYLKDNPHSSYKIYRGENIIKATPKQIAEVFGDIAHSCEWMYACKQATLIEKQGYDYWTYLQTKMPWPTTDRDAVIHGVLSQREKGIIYISLSTDPKKIPEKPDHVRVKTLEGFWLLTPRADGSTQVVTQMALEPGGSIPAWLANKFVVDSPFETLKALKKRVESAL